MTEDQAQRTQDTYTVHLKQNKGHIKSSSIFFYWSYVLKGLIDIQNLSILCSLCIQKLDNVWVGSNLRAMFACCRCHAAILMKLITWQTVRTVHSGWLLISTRSLSLRNGWPTEKSTKQPKNVMLECKLLEFQFLNHFLLLYMEKSWWAIVF